MTKTVADKKRVELSFSLAELPSSQHRAGLAGLIMILEYINSRRSEKFQFSVSELGASFSLSKEDLKTILDEVYAASVEIQARTSPFKGVEPVKVTEEVIAVEKDSKDAKGKKAKEKVRKLYHYPIVEPKGSFLYHREDEEGAVWTKLWRDMVWQILRGVPATRKPFEDRAKGLESSDLDSIWKQLSQSNDKSVELPSTYFLGAQAFSAERVPFRDNCQHQFLLHFWPFICQIYVPVKLDRDGAISHDGYVLAIPDIANLPYFLDEYKKVLSSRSNKRVGYRPKDCLIELPEEAAVDFLLRIEQMVGSERINRSTDDLIFGIDLFHTRKDGNNIRILYSGRVEPNRQRDSQYEYIKKNFFNPLFRRQRLVNLLVAEQEWYGGFDKLLSIIPIKEGLCSPFFAHDAQKSLEDAEEEYHRRMKLMKHSVDGAQPAGAALEALVLKIIDSYLRQKLQSKYKLDLKSLQNPADKRKYYDMRDSLAESCFYSIRSRSGEDFINFFASNICSVPQWMSPDEYSCLTKVLYEDTDKIRTLTMLALSARIKDKQEEQNND
ncbi:MAG: type I-MYXAN CRISPR-associated protein Cmx8 [Candidatus Obscuribacterales bacterium]|nr:type I-MYXAN CRISPR-associated protein Cmx8 [Candidatus Obscuribacterales bacterium]